MWNKTKPSIVSNPFVVILSLFQLAILPACQAPTIEADLITESDVMDLLEQWKNAYLSGNAAAMEPILADDWVYAGIADGSTSNKVASMQELAHADYSFLSMEFEAINIRYYGAIAVVVAKEELQIVSAEGDTAVIRLAFTDVYQKQNGLTRAISTHTSPIQ